MKKILAILLLLAIVGGIGMALAETMVDTTEVITQVVIWVLLGVLTALGAAATWVGKTYIIPWMKDVAVPWLKQHKLLEAAKTAVEYAEAMLGRYTGDQKWRMAVGLLEKLGFDVYSDEVIAALKAKWTELNLAQIAAGVKDAIDDTGGDDAKNS